LSGNQVKLLTKNTKDMTHNHLTDSGDRTERIFFALLCLALLVAMMLISCIASAQEPIKLAPKSNFKTVQTFKNSQGFNLPSTVSDTTKVYQIGSGPLFYWRISKKSGNIYKVYLKKDSTSIKTANK
jgi:hypothetical protein